MSSPSHRMPSARPEELEETAELPMLPDGTVRSGDTDDTNVMPALDALARTDSWQVTIEAPVAESAAVALPASDQVADKLRALTQSLRELEDRLHAKSEQLSVFEREVGTRDRRIATLEQQLTQAHADLAVREAARQSIESEALLAHRVSERHNEILQTLEVRRQLFETMVAEGEQRLAEASARQHQLEQQLSSQMQAAAARDDELQSLLAAERSRAEALQGQLSETQQNLATLQDRLQQISAAGVHQQADNADLMTRLAAEQGRTAELTAALAGTRSELEGDRARLAAATEQVALSESQLRDQLESIQALREELDEAQSRGDTALADLAAAEERIRDAEHQLRQAELRLEKHAEAEAVMRQQLLEMRGSLDERNGLIARLEREATSSAAVLGNIQQNLSRIEAGGAPLTEAAGGVARLLVRTEGDTGIVHVLGRRTTIGRTPDNDLQIDADYISRHHAVMLLTADGTVIEDLASTNGVYVNGKRISRAVLKEGDLVTIGRGAFRYVHKPAAERNG